MKAVGALVFGVVVAVLEVFACCQAATGSVG